MEDEPVYRKLRMSLLRAYIIGSFRGCFFVVVVGLMDRNTDHE